MTQVEFHFGAPDKLHYACRLLRKAASSGARVLVLADPATGSRLDSQLWALSPTDFVPHCQDTAPVSMQVRSPVVLGAVESAASVTDVPAFTVMINLGSTIPRGFQDFPRVIEVVSEDESDRDLARQRWKQYKALGHDIQRKDLKLRESH